MRKGCRCLRLRERGNGESVRRTGNGEEKHGNEHRTDSVGVRETSKRSSGGGIRKRFDGARGLTRHARTAEILVRGTVHGSSAQLPRRTEAGYPERHLPARGHRRGEHDGCLGENRSRATGNGERRGDGGTLQRQIRLPEILREDGNGNGEDMGNACTSDLAVPERTISRQGGGDAVPVVCEKLPLRGTGADRL